jgi:tetratricopeptide (TPR) repeat protein
VLLARIAVKRGNRKDALAHYAAASALDARYPGLVPEYETYLRSRKLGGWDDVDAYVAEYRQFIDAGPDDLSFQIRTRNNLAFTLRDVAAAWTSRGPARIHTFAEGAPPKAKETLHLAVALYEESAALVPEDAADLPFAERWVYAGVLNDLGLMLHYFPETQDLERAEACYLRAFELTDGAYQDAYFYNLQFLYAFELDGREAKWWELAKVAKDAILKEDPSAPGGFSPDPMKRTAARRDFDRLSAELGR